MKKISKIEIEHIASLARIRITDKEKLKYSKELSGILNYVEILDKVDTKNIDETSQVTGLENVYREDKTTLEWKVDKDVKKNTEKLLANTKSKKDGYIQVKKILD